MSARTRRYERDEVVQLLRNPSNKPQRIILILDSRFIPEELTTANRVRPDIHIFSGPAIPNLLGGSFMPLNLSNANSWVYSVLLQSPIVRPAYPRRVRYTSVSQWSPPIISINRWAHKSWTFYNPPLTNSPCKTPLRKGYPKPFGQCPPTKKRC